MFSQWLEDDGLEYIEVGKRDLERYLSCLKNQHEYAPKTIRGYFVPISMFYEDQADAGILEEDPTDRITLTDYAPKKTLKEEVTKEKRVWLNQDDINRLVDNVPGPAIQNRLVVLFMYFTGLRREEVANVKLEDLDRENREVKVRGKGGQNHTAYWQPKLDGLLTTWLDQGYRAASPYAEESPYLFVSESGIRMGGERINKIVRKAAENAGLQDDLYTDASGRTRHKITSHVIRHSFAMNFLENGGTFGDLSKLMAHSNLPTTEIYAEIQDSRAKEAYQEHAPDVDISF
jgi:integrase/recombinase XerD